MKCPRCKLSFAQALYGPCGACRAQLNRWAVEAGQVAQETLQRCLVDAEIADQLELEQLAAAKAPRRRR